MGSVFEGGLPFARIASLTASTSNEVGLINCRNLKKLTITGRVTYNASATTAVTLYFYYSPDGTNFDSISFESTALTITAGATVQATEIISVPDSGWLKIKATNGDGSYTATSIVVWVSVITDFENDRQLKAST